jgi:hypothetical protein
MKPKGQFVTVAWAVLMSSCATRPSQQPGLIAVTESSVSDSTQPNTVARTTGPFPTDNVARGELAGLVVDAFTGMPLVYSQVAIRAANLTTITDSLGKFRVVLPSARSTVLVRRVGYAPATLDVVRRADTGLVATVALRPEPVRLEFIKGSQP